MNTYHVVVGLLLLLLLGGSSLLRRGSLRGSRCSSNNERIGVGEELLSL